MRKGIDCRGREWEENIKSMSPDKDLTQRIFGKLTVLFRVQNDKQGLSQWLTECGCGNQIVVRGTSLRNGHTRSCGCAQSEIASKTLAKDFQPGDQVGYWTIIHRADGYKGKGAYWHCRCRCGTERDICGEHLRNKDSLSCGCLQKEMMAAKTVDLTGQKFGYWTVLNISKNRIADEVMWTCMCECGTIRDVSGHALKRGSSTSCGCRNSIGEFNIKQILDNYNIKYIHNRGYFENLKGVGGFPLRYDFILLDQNDTPYYLIEFDGPQHNEPIEQFGIESFYTTQQHDALKNQYALLHNIPLVRIPYSKRDDITYDDIFGNKFLINGGK